jgi:RNA polymerase sigma-70 factor (ECF subfamily)
MAEIEPDSRETLFLLDQAAGGDAQACERLLERHRLHLHDFVEAHLDPRLRARLDASDVVQEAQLEAARRLPDFLHRRPMPFRLWLCKTAYERRANPCRGAAEGGTGDFNYCPPGRPASRNDPAG